MGVVVTVFLFYGISVYYCNKHFCHNHVAIGRNTKQGLSKLALVDYPLEGTLLPDFRRAIDTYSIVKPENVKIIFVVAYYRSGSTFVGKGVDEAAPGHYRAHSSRSPVTRPPSYICLEARSRVVL